MRNMPIDSERCTMISTGKYAEVFTYAELSDGSRRRTDVQAKNDDGVPMWVVDCLIDDEDSDRAEIVGVKVATYEIPDMPKWRPVTFEGLMATVYVDRATGRAKTSFKATGIKNLADLQSRPKAA